MLHINPTSEELRTTINSIASQHLDVLVPYDQLNCEIQESEEESTNILFKYNLGTAEFSSHAMRQLLTRIHLSSSYWKRLDNWNAHQLMADNFDFCNESTANEISLQPRANDPTFLFRLKLNEQTKTSIEELFNSPSEEMEEEETNNFLTEVRAVLSSNYSKFDDNQLFPLLIDLLDQNQNISYTLYEYDDQMTRLHIKFNDTERIYEENTYHAGMIITNSEVGISSVWIEPSVYKEDLLYTNRDSLKKQNVQMKIVHRGDINTDRISGILSNCSQIAQIGVIQLIESLQQEIQPKLAFSLVQNIVEFPSRIALVLNDEWEQQEKLKKSEVTSAILEVARNLPVFQRSKVEQAAGKMIGLFDNYLSRITQIMEELDGK